MSNELKLELSYIISYCFFLWSSYQWEGGIFLFISIFTFGIPLIFVLLPFLGLNMFHTEKSSRLSLWYGISLSFPSLVLFFCVVSQPLYQTLDENGGKILLPFWVTVAVIGSSLLFLTISTISYRHMRQVFKEKREKLE